MTRNYNIKKKICTNPLCGIIFEGTILTKYCCTHCRRKNNYLNHKEYYNNYNKKYFKAHYNGTENYKRWRKNKQMKVYEEVKQ